MQVAGADWDDNVRVTILTEMEFFCVCSERFVGMVVEWISRFCCSKYDRNCREQGFSRVVEKAEEVKDNTLTYDGMMYMY